MRSARWLAVTSGFLVGGAAVYASGCVSSDEYCALTLTCPGDADAGPGKPDGSPPDPACTGSPMSRDGGTPAQCGIFADPDAPEAGSDGSQKMPFRSLQKAVDTAKAAGKPVFACAKPFAEHLQVPSGVTIYGGLDCGHDWVWAASPRTVVKPAAGVMTKGGSEIAARLSAGAGTTVIEDVDVAAPDGAAPGVSSIAVMIEDTGAEVSRCDFTAGNGAAGEVGAHLADDPALDGIDGSAGFNICAAQLTNPGATGPMKTCSSGGASAGGDGGSGGPPTGASLNGGNGIAGTPPDVNFPSAGLGGNGQSTTGCTNGNPGADGSTGLSGLGATGLGALSAKGYAGTSGMDGGDGKPGQGGGGGGGAKGKTQVVCSGSANFDRAGASGGSGGTGSCGGAKGGGGQAGGSSIAVASIGTKPVTLKTIVLTVGNAGNGGSGGDGQSGGHKGHGKAGGSGANGSLDACSGGDGGQGGQGGPGGGGHGGHAIGVAFKGTAPAGTPTVKFKTTPPTVGIGGAAGANSADPVAGKGADGTSGAMLKL
jgi:hypothetical protein